MKLARGVLLAMLVACSASRPPRYVEAEHRAERAYSSGRYAEAARHWLEAEKHADARRDAHEARYRAAASFDRAGELKRADALYRSLDREGSERGARAALARAEIARREGSEERAQELVLSALRRYPAAGTSARLLAEHLAFVEKTGGPAAALKRLDELIVELSATELDERLRYERARRLDESGETARALEGYLDAAQRHPYPDGALWDDALYRAALCEKKLGHPRQAIALLERLLAEREAAHMTGSYERSRYAEARFTIATLYRDELGDAARARREFRRVWDDHTTSLLRDDALFQEAVLAAESGHRAEACGAAALLVREAPDSRFAGCVTRLCPSLSPPAGTRCRDYLVREYFGERGDDGR